MDQSDGFVAFKVTGEWAYDTFKHEVGGHRWQRIPPNDKKGRVHTSTVTVAVLEEPPAKLLVVNSSDLQWVFSRGSGAGGQHRNKTESAVDLTHTPTGLVVHCESERSQQQNKAIALSKLRARLWDAQQGQAAQERAKTRKDQLGTGQRGDKSWTVRTQDDQVTYHPTGQKFRLKDYLEGDYTIQG